MIRAALPTQTSEFLAIARNTAVFQPWELEALRELLDAYSEREDRRALGHRLVSCDRDGETVGFAYFAPAAMTDRTWYLSWLAVAPEAQGQGFGTALLRVVEEDIRLHQGRLLWIEVPSRTPYEPARNFLVQQGYEQAALLRDYYADGDDLVVFRKRLLAPEAAPEALRTEPR
jgi:ribosomal protein S18 acetylase RimI-like enzyme